MSERNDTIDPNSQRVIQTRDGVAAIPRDQAGVPLKDYFRNAELPADLNRALVYVTRDGPVLAKPDPVGWTAEHGEKAQTYAARLKTLIDEKGYYAKTLGVYADRLADQTGHPKEEMKAVIADAFQREHGKDPWTYLQDRRRERGLPVRHERGETPEPEA